MKVLINRHWKAIETGPCLFAIQSRNEFILDTKIDNQFHISVLKDIAERNKITIPTSIKKSRQILDIIEIGILNMTEQAQEEVNQEVELINKIDEIVKLGHEAGSDDDSVMLEIYKLGIKFQKCASHFKKSLDRQNLRATKKDVLAKGREILIEQEFETTDFPAYEAKAKEIRDAIEGCELPMAMASVRAYCKEFAQEIPKQAKEPKGTIMDRVFAYIVANPNAGGEGLKAHLEAQDKGDEKQVLRFSKFLKFAEDFHSAKVASETIDEPTPEETEAA